MTACFNIGQLWLDAIRASGAERAMQISLLFEWLSNQWRRRFARALVLALIATILAEALSAFGALRGFERYYADLWYRLAGQQAPVTHVVLVKLDEATLADYPDEPLVFWGPRLGQAINTLRQVGVRVIGVDLLFSASPEQWFARLGGTNTAAARRFDLPLRRELASGQVVLAGIQAERETLLPAADYLVVLPNYDVTRYVGVADFLPDADGTLRAFHTSAAPASSPGEPPLLSLPLLLAIHASGQSVRAEQWRFGGRSLQRGQRLSVAFAGPPGSVPSLSLRELLAPDALRNPRVLALRGKVAIIGATYGGMNDVHMTPYGRGLLVAPLMLGVEIQAQTVESMLAGRFVDDVPRTGILLLAGLYALAGAWLWAGLRLPLGVVVLGGALVLAAVGGYMAFLARHLVPVAQLQLSALLAFAGIYGWRFSHGERERSRLRGLFARYVEPRVVDALLASSQPPQLGGELVEVTVLFTDIRNFTSISEQLAATEVVTLLNHYFERACAVLAEEGACVDKFMGDAIMAEFGVPLKTPDHARQALLAAIRLRRVAEDFRGWMQQHHGGRDLPEFRIGIGVHTGVALVGNIGTPSRMEYTAIGDSVNVASRLEGLTKDLGCDIVASQETLAAAGPGFQVGRSATLNVKGRRQAVAVWEVLGQEGTDHEV